MARRADEEDEEEREREMSSSEEDDDVFDEDMEALRRACMITGTNPDDLHNASSSSTGAAVGGAVESISGGDDDDDDDDDLELVRNIRKRFSTFSDALEPLLPKPLCVLPPATSDEDEDDDFETLRAIQKRFAAYDYDDLKNSTENPLEKQEQVFDPCASLEKGSSNDLTIDKLDPCKGSSSKYACRTTPELGDHLEMQPYAAIEWHHGEPSNPSTSQANYSRFPKSAKVFMDAIKKNRSFQKILRSKLIHIEAKIEENKKLKERVKILRDFQVSCKRRTGRALSQMKDSRVQLISRKKSWPSKDSKVHDKKISAMYFGPVENPYVANYKMALTKFPLSLDRKKWSENEKKNLGKGIQQQFQEMMVQTMVDRLSGSEEYHEVSSDLDNILVSIKNFNITPESTRGFLPKVNWEHLASMHVVGRSGAECEARWLNFEDPLINRNPWTAQEDKNLLLFVQEKGISNWIDIAASLRTNRTPFQCLARYQRSLNVSILKREWTKDEDAKLRSAVEAFGESDWQSVASVLEGWTGTQCSNRWKKSLHPTREKVGRWTEDEDKRLKVAQLLFGPRNWKKTAQFVPGRTEVQCRERWVNSLDPSLNWDKWTEEEDFKLRTAIAEHGYCWAKVAAALPRRTDNMCRRRWKRLLPDEVPLLQAARRIKKAAFIGNFVDRESERPALCPSDFSPLPMITSSENINHSEKQTGKLREAKKRNLKKSRESTQTGQNEELGISNYGEVATSDGPEAITRQDPLPMITSSENINHSKKQTGKLREAKKRNLKKSRENTETGQKEVLGTSNYGKVATSDGPEAITEQDPLPMITSCENINHSKKETGKLREAKKRNLKKSRENTETGSKEVLGTSNYGEVATSDGPEAITRQDPLPMITSSENINHSKKQTGKLREAKKRNLKKSRENTETGPKEVLGTSNYGEVETLDGHEAIIMQGSRKSNLSKPGPDTKREKRSCEPLSKRTELTEPNSERECLLLQPERLNLTSDRDCTEPLVEINTPLTKTKTGSKRQYCRHSSANSGELQRSLPSGKSLLTEIDTNVTLQHDGSSCLDSTELMVSSSEKIGTLGGNENMALEKTTGTKQYRRRNRSGEPPGGSQDVVTVPSHDRLKKLKSRDRLSSDQNLVTADDDIPLISLLSKKSKKRKLKANECGSNQACQPLIIETESEMFPEHVDTSHPASLMLSSSMQDDELTCCDGIAVDKSSSCNVGSALLMASDDEPGRLNLVGGQKVACQEPVKEVASIDVESGHDADDLSLASFVRKKPKMECQASKSGNQTCPPSSLIRGSQLLSKRVNQLHNGNHTTFTASDCETSELDLVAAQESALDELKTEEAEDNNEVDELTLASLQNRSRKKRRL